MKNTNDKQPAETTSSVHSSVWCPAYHTPEARQRAYSILVKHRGERYADCTFESFKIYDDVQRAAWERLQSFGRSMPSFVADGGGVVLYGKEGTGKDHLLLALAKVAILDHGYDVRFTHGLNLYGELRNAIHEHCSEQEVLDRYIKPQILILSDPIPPKGEASRYGIESLQRILDARYRELRSTWVSINATGREGAEDILTEPLVDRLTHGSGSILCNWPSYRERNRASW